MDFDVTGYAKVANFQNLFQTEPEYFTHFSLIISANLPEAQLLPLAALCWGRGIPLLVVKSYGLVGSVRLQLKEHSVVESRSEADAFDLRVSRPFPLLQAYCESAALEMPTLDSLEHAHVPYPVILHAAAAKWRAMHVKNPSSFAEKESFKGLIRGMSRDFNNETNFHEAVRESYRAYALRELSEPLQLLLAGAGERGVTAASSDFDILVKTLSLFVAERQATLGDGTPDSSLLPLPGNIPDLTATTERFVAMQRVYQAQAQADLTHFRNIMHALVLEAGGQAFSR
ncbi:hypothetical protein B484DRAFT_403078 [Ochromonadaceae sp. CCMP2298]|nr:hypothetical protein B484DRAFT_403078 [Ochromonadaceae sp. CCMP2298]